MNYTTNEIGDREIDFLQSNKKGDAFKMFKREAGGQFMKKGVRIHLLHLSNKSLTSKGVKLTLKTWFMHFLNCNTECNPT